jgi:glyoxylase-like metal-dependent hydrolase (beta-lactamase superfamily II)
MSLNRRSFLKVSALGFGAAATSFLPGVVKAMLADGSITMMRNNVGFYTNRGGTIGLLTNNDGSVVVDSQFPEAAKALLTHLKNKEAADIAALINTHHHGDHVGGNSEIGAEAGDIIAHENVLALLNENDSKVAKPTKTYSETHSFDVGNETIRLMYKGRGHTKGDSVVLFENANIIHMGDLVFNRVHPFIDRPGGASIANWQNILTEVHDMASDDTQFIFGHGSPDAGITGSRKDLIHLRSYFEAVVETAQKGIVTGMSRDEVTAKSEIPGFENHVSFGDRLSPSFVLGVAYDELSDG